MRAKTPHPSTSLWNDLDLRRWLQTWWYLLLHSEILVSVRFFRAQLSSFLQIIKRTHSFAGMKAGLYIQSIRVKTSGLERVIATQACVLVWLLLTSGKFLFSMSPVDSSEMFSFCVKWRVGLSWEACDDKGEVMKWLVMLEQFHKQQLKRNLWWGVKWGPTWSRDSATSSGC